MAIVLESVHYTTRRSRDRQVDDCCLSHVGSPTRAETKLRIRACGCLLNSSRQIHSAWLVYPLSLCAGVLQNGGLGLLAQVLSDSTRAQCQHQPWVWILRPHRFRTRRSSLSCQVVAPVT